MTGYASKTTVDIDRTQSEIRKLLKKYEATGFGLLELDGRESVAFQMAGLRIRFSFTEIRSEDFEQDSMGRPRTPQNLKGGSIKSAVEQARRTRWRELLLLIRAKLVAIDSGITTVEEEFHAHIVLPSGQTMSEWTVPYLKNAYITGQMPPMLPSGGSTPPAPADLPPSDPHP